MSNREILFRGKRVDTNEWVEGFYLEQMGAPFIGQDNQEGFDSFQVIHATVGQLRYTKGDQRYFDGDVYYQAGYGKEIVSELCELQCALLDGNESDIEGVIGNIH